MNAIPVTDQYMKNAKNFGGEVIHRNPPLAAKVSSKDDKHFNPFDTSLAITSTVSRYRSDLPSNKILQTSVAKTECKRNVGVTVAGARPPGSSVLLKNRFQPLQMLMTDNYVEPQSEEVLQGLNNDKHSLSNAVNAESIQSNVKPLLASQENKSLVGKKTKLGFWQRE